MAEDELEKEIDKLNNHLAENYLNTIQILASIATLLERYYNGSHSRFVSQKSAQIAEILGLNEVEIFEIKIAGLLHDIGKVGMKDSVQAKFQSEMNHLELKQYYLHPTLGMNIIKKFSGMENIAKIIGQHHERYDGSGFPNGLSRANIKTGAKIISVVDYFHNAVYKKLRTRAANRDVPQKITSTISYLDSINDMFDSTIRYLQQKSGILFDARIVDIFTSIIIEERSYISKRAVMKVLVNKLVPGMVIAEDYFTSYGLLIIAKGEIIKQDTIKNLIHFAEIGEISKKLLVIG